MRFLAALVGAMLLVLVGVWLWLAPQLASFETPGVRPATVTVEVPSGATLKQTALLLQNAGLVADARLFYYDARYKQVGAPKAGEYEIGGELSALQALAKIHRGEVKQYELGFPEGLTYKEVAAHLAESPLVKPADFIAACEDEAFLKAQGVTEKNCEGYLFPDTYKFARGRSAKEIVATLIRHHQEVFAHEVASKLGTMSHHDLVTLASIVEKETGAASDRPHIASVFLNRLKKGMRLATDPTVIYAVTLARGAFDGNLRHDDLLLDIPYNTYKRLGLPPGPICNPGRESMLAVVQPLPSNDLFFVSRNNGSTVFCPTYECHEAAVKKWQVEYFRKR